jgi:hypothetical protein
MTIRFQREIVLTHSAFIWTNFVASAFYPHVWCEEEQNFTKGYPTSSWPYQWIQSRQFTKHCSTGSSLPLVYGDRPIVCQYPYLKERYWL